MSLNPNASPIYLAGGGNSFNNAAAVSPNDTTDLTNAAAALWVGTAGNIVLITAGGQTVTINSVANGTLLPIACTRVKATNTTATNIVQLY